MLSRDRSHYLSQLGVEDFTFRIERAALRHTSRMDEQAAETAEARLSEALEYVDRARGHLFSFHQLVGHADFLLDEVIEAADKADLPELSELVRRTLYGMNVLSG